VAYLVPKHLCIVGQFIGKAYRTPRLVLHANDYESAADVLEGENILGKIAKLPVLLQREFFLVVKPCALAMAVQEVAKGILAHVAITSHAFQD